MKNVTNAKKNRRPQVSFKEKDAGERWVRLTRETQDTSWSKWRQTWGLVAHTPRPRRTRKTDITVRRLEIERSQLEDERAASLEEAVADKHQSREVDC